MSDETKTTYEILPPQSPARAAIDLAKQTWDAAIARCEAAHRAVIANLDQASSFSLIECAASGAQPDNAEAATNDPKFREKVLARMENRTLALADALQRHALIRIMEAGTAADEIGRAAAGAPFPPSKDRNT